MKRFYAFSLLLIATLLCSISTSAHDFEVDGIYYKIYKVYISGESKQVVAVTFKGDSFDEYTNEYTGNVVIPEIVTYAGNTYTVTSIDEAAFRGCSDLTSVSIASSINSIGGYAFSDCFSLSKINITDSVTYIGGFAFSDCISLTEINIPNTITDIFSGTFLRSALTSITIPNSVTSIGGGAFQDTGLTEINIPNSVTSIGGGAFLGCSRLTDINIPNSVTSIGGYAFRNCTGLTSITIPNSVTSIGGSAFSGCDSLAYVSIGNSVTNIGAEAFYNCKNLKELRFEDSSTELDISKSSLSYNNVIETLYLGRNIIGSFKTLKNVTIGNTVTNINSIFDRCSGLTSIVVKSGNIVYDSRDNCNAIIETATNTLIKGSKTTIIPNSVPSIGVQAFMNCTGLTSITIPNSVTSIGALAFSDCSGLTSITIGSSVNTIGYEVFKGCSGLTEIVVEGENSVYDSRDNCNAIIKTITNRLIAGCNTTIIPNSVTSIDNGAFYNCSGLTEIIIPESVIDIGNDAFYGTGWYNNQPDGVLYLDNCCLGSKGPLIGDLTLAEGTRLISAYAFKWCGGLTSVTIPNSVKILGGYAFQNCAKLESVTIGNSVNDIPFATFYECTNLKSITIGSSVKEIDHSAFSVCSGLEFIKVLNSIPPKCDDYAFTHYNSLLEVPEGSLDAYRQAKVWRNFSNITEVSGIEDIKVDATEVEEVARYDIDGRLLTEPTPGINIIKMSDGTTRKEWVK